MSNAGSVANRHRAAAVLVYADGSSLWCWRGIDAGCDEFRRLHRHIERGDRCHSGQSGRCGNGLQPFRLYAHHACSYVNANNGVGGAFANITATPGNGGTTLTFTETGATAHTAPQITSVAGTPILDKNATTGVSIVARVLRFRCPLLAQLEPWVR